MNRITLTTLARCCLGALLACALTGTFAATPKKSVVKPAAVVETPVPLSPAELALAEKVQVGKMPCELGQSVDIEADKAAPGYFNLHLKDQRFHVRPVVSATGALRLEDVKEGAVWLQLANKSMLMSQKLGRRLADECMSPTQQAVADDMKIHPAPNLLDVAQKSR